VLFVYIPYFTKENKNLYKKYLITTFEVTKKKKKCTNSVFLLFLSLQILVKATKLNSAEIYNQIQKLNFLGSVLYIAAHPDDENTRLISYLSNDVKARTGYLLIKAMEPEFNRTTVTRELL
jgi:hypothetical protein